MINKVFGQLTGTGHEVMIAKTSHRGRSILCGKSRISSGAIILCEEPFVCVSTSVLSTPEAQAELIQFHSRYHYKPHETQMLEEASRHLKREFNGQAVILASRMILASQQSPSLKKIAHSFYKVKAFKQSTEADQAAVEVAISIVQMLVMRFSGRSVDASLCRDVLNRISCNGFTVVDCKQNSVGIGMYANAALINHSCQPNCIQSFDGSGRLYIRSLRCLHPGEEVTISYIDVCSPTWRRRSELYSGYGFNCHCPLCVAEDPSESVVENLLCPKCHNRCSSSSDEDFNFLTAAVYKKFHSTSTTGARRYPQSSLSNLEPFFIDCPLPGSQLWLTLARAATASSHAQATVVICHACQEALSAMDFLAVINEVADCWQRYKSHPVSLPKHHWSRIELLIAVNQLCDNLFYSNVIHFGTISILAALTSELLDLILMEKSRQDNAPAAPAAACALDMYFKYSLDLLERTDSCCRQRTPHQIAMAVKVCELFMVYNHSQAMHYTHSPSSPSNGSCAAVVTRYREKLCSMFPAAVATARVVYGTNSLLEDHLVQAREILNAH